MAQPLFTMSMYISWIILIYGLDKRDYGRFGHLSLLSPVRRKEYIVLQVHINLSISSVERLF